MSLESSSPLIEFAPLHIDVCYPEPSTTRAVISGEIDLATVPALRETLLGMVHDPIPAILDLDLAQVTFLDCAGIGVLVSARRAAAKAGRQMWITHPPPIVRLVLELTGLLSVFTAPAGRPLSERDARE
jgi:anti-anti-sigma factor